jgi:hypothetical protein
VVDDSRFSGWHVLARAGMLTRSCNAQPRAWACLCFARACHPEDATYAARRTFGPVAVTSSIFASASTIA